MPFEYTYMPLIPGLTALVSKLSACSIAEAFNRISGFVYCLGPVALYLYCWRTSARVFIGLCSAVAYSLLTPSMLFVPDGPFRLAGVLDARRLFLLTVWDETPHLMALGLFPLLLLGLTRSYETHRWLWYWATGAAMALMLLASAFGAVLIVVGCLCLLLTCEKYSRKYNAGITILIALSAYIVVSPFVPPSLFLLIRSDAQSRLDSSWSLSSVTAIGILVSAWVALLPVVNRLSNWSFRAILLFCVTFSAITLLAVYGGRRFLPQPERYKFEMDLGVASAGAFAVYVLWRRLPTNVRICTILVLASVGAEQIRAIRKSAKQLLAPADITRTIEFRVAKWLERHFRDDRVMMGGSLGGGWLNTFTDIQQFSGSSFPTAPNQVHQSALLTILWGLQSTPHDGEIAVTWLRAYGVSAVGVPGPDSPEYWKPFAGPKMFEGILPAIWREQDTTVYAIPRKSSSLAHAIDTDAIVWSRPRDGFDIGRVREYVAALDLDSTTSMRWEGYNRAVIKANLRDHHAISVQVTYHPGWQARANGIQTLIVKDGLGLMVLRPPCKGVCEIELSYNGGLEMESLRALSPMALCALILFTLREHRRAKRLAAQ